MGFRLKTSKKTKDLFEELCASSNLKPFALSKMAIAMSLRDRAPIDEFVSKDTTGLELQRSTVTGEFDSIFKALIQMNLERKISDDEYYPHYMKLHIDRGAQLLYNKYKYSGSSLEKFLSQILNERDASI